MTKTRKIVVISLLISLGLVLHLVESFFPLSAVVHNLKLKKKPVLEKRTGFKFLQFLMLSFTLHLYKKDQLHLHYKLQNKAHTVYIFPDQFHAAF
jgi:hypothetical protein